MERISEGTKAGVGRISEGTKAGVDHLLQETRSGLERFQQGAEYGIELMKVPSSELRDEIIAAQDQLIVLLGEEQADPEQITELRTEIMEKKKKLMDRQRRLPGTRNPDPETPKQA
ncbi:MAG: hypothetical protein Q4B01_03495 [Eubacteriales bacterium]|nr:hypothetical protein [Eubacteriales bacterium]